MQFVKGKEVDGKMKYSRMRRNILGLPTCPDWRRKRRVGNLEEEEPATELEIEQLALDALKLKRQQSMDERHQELIELRQQLMAENINEMTEKTGDFMANSQNGEIDYVYPISMQKMVEFGKMENGANSSASAPHSKTMDCNVLSENSAEQKKIKKLEDLRKELDEFKAIHHQLSQNYFDKETNAEFGGNEEDEPIKDESYQFVSKFSSGSNLSLVTLQSGNEGDNEVNQRIQKMRERELIKYRRQNILLEYRLKNQNMAKEMNSEFE